MDNIDLYDSMDLDELKEYAHSIGLKFGKIGKDKLIERIIAAEQESAVDQVLNDDDYDDAPAPAETVVNEEDTGSQPQKTDSLLDSISSVIDDLDDVESEEIEPEEDLPLDTMIPVKSITYGELIYKSKSNNVPFTWKKIGAVEYMTVAELNEMNNYKESFLKKPLVILMDERAIRKFHLTSVYEKVAKINNLKEVFNSHNIRLIENTVDIALSANMRDILISKVRQMYKNKTLTDINIIRLLEKKLQFDLSDDE